MSSPAAVRDQTPFIELSRVNRELKASILAEIEALALFLASKGSLPAAIIRSRSIPSPAFAHLGDQKGAFPATEAVAAKLISLPISSASPSDR
jgi:hypothetical protein